MALFGDNYKRLSPMLQPNVYVYITGTIAQRGAGMRWFKEQADEKAEFELNISNEKKAEVVRTIIENVEVSAEADTHVQNMSAAAQRDGGTSAASVEIVNAGSEVAGAGAAADVSVDGVEVQE